MAGTVMVYGGTLGSALAEPAQVSLEAEQAAGASQYESSAALRISHEGGPAVAPADLAVVVDGERVANRSNLTLSYSASTFGVGEHLVVEQTSPAGLTGGEEVLLLQDTGDSAFRLRSFTVEGGGPGAGPSVFGFEASVVGESPADPWAAASTWPDGTTEVRADPARSGERALYLSTASDSCDNDGCDVSTATATVRVNLTGVAEIRVDYYDQNDAQIRVDGTSRTGGYGDSFAGGREAWNTISIDTSSDTGIVDLTLANREQTRDSGSAQVYFDDIRFYDADGDRIAAEDVLP
ncbi:hypothetical protein JCM30237_17190 [Halolamina litorea]